MVLHLYSDGYASSDEIDATIRDGLGLRWAFMGPFETIDLNAPGGIKDEGAEDFTFPGVLLSLGKAWCIKIFPYSLL